MIATNRLRGHRIRGWKPVEMPPTRRERFRRWLKESAAADIACCIVMLAAIVLVSILSYVAGAAGRTDI